MDKIFDHYLADMHDVIPVGRAASFLVTCCLFALSHAEARLGLVKEFLLLGPANFPSRVWALLTFGDALIAAILVGIGAVMAKFATELMVVPIWNRLGTTQRMQKLVSRYSVSPPVMELEVIREARRRRVRGVSRLHQSSELAFVLSMALIVLFTKSAGVDLLVALGFLGAGGFLLLLATIRYLRRVVPYDVHLAALVGAHAPTRPDLSRSGE